MKQRPSTVRNITPTVFIILLLLIGTFPGCSPSTPPPPKTYQAKGKVVYSDNRPMSGGVIEFRSTTNSSLTTTGTIESDGTFVLYTMTPYERVLGAIEGPFKVTIMPYGSGTQEDPQAMPPPIILQQQYTIKPNDDNNFTITIERK